MPSASVMSRRTRAWIERILDAVESKLGGLPPTPETLGERTAWSSVAHSGRRLLRTADKLMESDPASAEAIVFDLAQMLSGFLEGSRYFAGEQVEVLAPSNQAANARKARQNSPEERALLKAVQDAVANKSPEQIASRGMASRILPEVNRSVIKAGFEKVSVDAVRRRLNNLRS